MWNPRAQAKYHDADILKLRSDARHIKYTQKHAKKLQTNLYKFTKIRKYLMLVDNYARASESGGEKN